MDGVTASASMLKAIASYGVLGLGWVAWILTMVYLQAERKRYQALVIHIIQHFTKTGSHEPSMPAVILGESDDKPKAKHATTFKKLFGSEPEF